MSSSVNKKANIDFGTKKEHAEIFSLILRLSFKKLCKIAWVEFVGEQVMSHHLESGVVFRCFLNGGKIVRSRSDARRGPKMCPPKQ